MEHELLSTLGALPSAVRVAQDASVEAVVRAALASPGSQIVCVVGGAGQLLGVIDLRRLFRSVFFHHADPGQMVRHLLELTSSETAGQLMVTDPAVVTLSDSLESAIRSMVEHDKGELPVVDARGRLQGTVTVSVILERWLAGRAKRDPAET